MTHFSSREPRCAATVWDASKHPKHGSILMVWLTEEPPGVRGGPIYRPMNEIAWVPREGDKFTCSGVHGEVLGVDDGYAGRGARVLGCVGAEPHPPQIGVWVDAMIPQLHRYTDIDFYAACTEGKPDV